MKKPQKIIAVLLVFGLLGLIIFSAHSSHQRINTKANSNPTTLHPASPNSAPQEQAATTSSATDLSTKLPQEQAVVQRDEATAQSFSNSANSINSTSLPTVPTSSTYSSTATAAPTTISSGCNLSLAQTAVQPYYAQIKQLSTQITQLQGQISSFQDSYNNASSKWGYSGSGYDSQYSSTLSSYQQQLSSLNTQKQSLLSQIQPTEAQYGC